jgi:E3 ubiquitin-protein ligase RNF115/126
MDAIRAEMEATQVTRGAPNALSILSLILNTRDRNGVQSQEEMDRVITQLMEESLTTGTAAPPASENAIRSLPKKKVDKDMLGVEGKAECSICMDGVEVDIEVAVLPCTHWFHSDCIGAWLKQHNTCPHCRRSINLNVA